MRILIKYNTVQYNIIRYSLDWDIYLGMYVKVLKMVLSDKYFLILMVY